MQDYDKVYRLKYKGGSDKLLKGVEKKGILGRHSTWSNSNFILVRGSFSLMTRAIVSS